MKGSTLAAFAATHRVRTGIKCWACGIPEAEEIAKEYRAGVRETAILAWLREVRGYPVSLATPNKVGNHLRNHVGRAA